MNPIKRVGVGVWPSLVLASLCLVLPARAGEQAVSPEEFRKLSEQVEGLANQLKEKDRKIESLEGQVQSLSRKRPTQEEQRDALTEAMEQLERDRAKAKGDVGPSVFSVPLGGGSNFRLIDVSFDVLTAFGASSEREESLANLQGGGHDPRKRGFTLQNTELSLTGAVDPYLYAEAHIIYFIEPFEGETVVELEEAFVQTQTLPWGLMVEAGQSFLEFGRINPQHPHQWAWLDQPVINTRVFGPDGARQTGARLDWLAPLPWYSQFSGGLYNANGETMGSFLANDEFYEERAIGGRPFTERDVRSANDLAYLMRWVNAFDVNDQWSLALGGSALYGPNASGPDGQTWIYGADLVVKFRPEGHDRGWPFLTWQSEVTFRDYDADSAVHVGPDGAEGTPDDVFLPSDTLHDWGFYSQLLYGFRRGWATGLRYEFAGGSGDGVDESGAFVSRNDDPFRDDRHRVSPLLIWQPTEFSRFRLQYNYDNASHLDAGHAHSVWLGVEFLFGSHPAHSY